MAIRAKKTKLYIVIITVCSSIFKIQKKMAGKEVQKKTAVIFLLIAVILSIAMTMYILNYVQTPRVTQAGSKESSSGGGISLTLKNPPIIKDESEGGVSLTVLPP